MNTRPGHLIGNVRLALFASGDFACNLYWQSLTFFLFFFYTEVVGLSAGSAGLVMLAGSVWDGAAALTIGAWVQRMADYRRCMLIAAAPLGIAFVLLYVVPPLAGMALAASVLIVHLAFRTLYALVNIPFAALSARISRSSSARSRIAAYRMLFGTAAAIGVALVTRTLSLTRQGTITGESGYLIAAAGFAAVATTVLVIVARTTPSHGIEQPVRGDNGALAGFSSLLANRAFVTLNLAAAAAVIAGGVLNGTILFYFTYAEHDAAAGPAAMAWMGIAGAIAIPVWIRLRDWIGTRCLWLIDAALALAALAIFALIGRQGVLATQVFLFVMQTALIGFFFAFWAMLPDTVEWGELHGGRRLEALTFGAAAFGQKLAGGAASALLGLLLDAGGYSAGHVTTHTASSIRIIMLAVPALMLTVSAAVMAANPLRRDTHSQVVATLGARETAG